MYSFFIRMNQIVDVDTAEAFALSKMFILFCFSASLTCTDISLGLI